MKKIIVMVMGCLVWTVNPALLLTGCGVPVPGFDDGCPPPRTLEFEPGQVTEGLSRLPKNQIVQLDDFSLVEVEIASDGLSQRTPSPGSHSWIQSAHALSCDDTLSPPDERISMGITIYTWTREQGRGQMLFSADNVRGTYSVGDTIRLSDGESMFGGELDYLEYSNSHVGGLSVLTDQGRRLEFKKYLFDVDAHGMINEDVMDDTADMGIQADAS